MLYIKILSSIILSLVLIVGGIPSMIEEGVDAASIITSIFLIIMIGLLLKSIYKDIKNPENRKSVTEKIEENKIVQIEREKKRYKELKEKCNFETIPLKKIRIIKDYRLKPYSKIADKILSSKDNVSLRIDNTNALIEADLLNNDDLHSLLEIFNDDYEKIIEKKKLKQEKIERLVEQQRNSPKQIYKQNKKKGIVTCPKCGSSSITTTNKKLSVTRGVIGGAILGPIGAGVGAVTSKKIYCVCMNCGHKWKP